MPTGVMLDDVSLPLVQDVRTFEDQAWVAHRVPGLDGAAIQNLGRRPLTVVVVGATVDEDSLAALTTLRRKFRAHQPVPFTADIATATNVTRVIVDDLRVTEVAGSPQQYRYWLRLIEHVPPPPPAGPPAGPDLSSEGSSLLNDITGALGSLPGLPNLLDLNLVNPTPPLRSLVETFTATTRQVSGALGPLNDLLG